MASVGSTAASRVFGVSYRDVQSGTRAKWSARDTQAFEAFAHNHRATSKDAKLTPKTDITSLLDALQLSWFFSRRVLNSEGNDLAPILEVKVRRKLQGVWAEMSPIDNTTLKKTRLQTLRSQAVQAGQTPPEKLATMAEWKDQKYSPERWTPRKAQKARQDPFSTVNGARKEVARLAEALQLARHKLEELEKAEEAEQQESDDSKQEENEDGEEEVMRRQELAYSQV